MVRAETIHCLAIGAWLHRRPEQFTWIARRAELLGIDLSALLWLQYEMGVSLGARQAICLASMCGHRWNAWAAAHMQDVEMALEAALQSADCGILEQAIAAKGPARQSYNLRLTNPELTFSLLGVELTRDSAFQQRLRDLLASGERAAQAGLYSTARPAQPSERTKTWINRGWYVALEFGESSSSNFTSVVNTARRHPGFVKLLDEKREIVYRNIYTHSDLAKFWRLFGMVRAWRNTRVFVNGQPVGLLDVYPGAPGFD